MAETTEMESDPSVGEAREEEDASPESQEPEAQPAAQTEDLATALSERETRLAALEETLGERDARIAQLEAALGEAEAAAKSRDEETEAVNARLVRAVELYRTALLAAEPDLPEEMVHGATVEAVQESLERARQVVAQVRSRLEAQASLERTPMGVPARSAPDLSALSPQEKILMGLSGR